MSVDPMTAAMASRVPGPGRYEWGALAFSRPERRQSSLEVELDEDGRVSVYWTEPADDYCGTYERRATFTAEEFDQLVAVRAALRSEPAAEGSGE